MAEKNWYKNAVVYQLYPKSFYDSNGDGIGDIRGIIQKLDYIQSLGVTVIWLCPVYCSPMKDNGYDISDYYRIDPSFGNNDDLDELIELSRARGIGVVMDMVVNHCSDQHEWFQKAIADPEGPFADYFYIRKGQQSGPPNNWRCWFGGSAWEPIENTPYYYLHVFTKQQPDLNWENPKLREEIFRIMNFWLDKGVVGFRLDAITDLKKLPGLPSLPPDGEDGLAAVNRWTENVPGIGAFLSEMKERTYGRVNAMTVGEAGGVKAGELMDYISLDDGYFSMIFDFSISRVNVGFYWCDVLDWNTETLKQRLQQTVKQNGSLGWMGIVLENHDQPRCIDHFLPESGRNFYGASLLALMQLMRRGTPFVYQGQEIGMRNVAWADIQEYDDVSSHSQYQEAKRRGFSDAQAMAFIHSMSRDNSRTPFQWSSALSAGFTTGKPWLKANEQYAQINVEKQEQDQRSLLNWYRKLIKLRTSSPWTEVLIDGSEEYVYQEIPNLLAYVRELNGQKLFILCNFQDREQVLALGTFQTILADNYGRACLTDGQKITLRPYEAVLLA
ncbi:MAG: alpha-glucosidase [Eubacteriales bacterium]|nr:alpha-glucosidase [Eubacteriales bacterium]